MYSGQYSITGNVAPQGETYHNITRLLAVAQVRPSLGTYAPILRYESQKGIQLI